MAFLPRRQPTLIQDSPDDYLPSPVDVANMAVEGESGPDPVPKRTFATASLNVGSWLRLLKNSAVFKIEQHLTKPTLFFVILIQWGAEN